MEVGKLRWQHEEWAELAEELWQKYAIQHFSCDRSNPEAISYFNLRLGKRMGKNKVNVAVKCPPIGGGHQQHKDKLNQIDLMREGLGSPDGHQRTFLLDSAHILGFDEELRSMGRPTCSEQEVESWSFDQKPGEDRPDSRPDPKADDHFMDAWRYDEVLNYARGFGSRFEVAKAPKDSVAAMWDEVFERKEQERGGKSGWQRRRKR